MRITELLSPQSIALHQSAESQAQIIDKLVDLQSTHGNITDKAAYKAAIYAREAEGSTTVENGITVPHARCKAVTKPSLAAATLKDPVQYNEEDDDPSSLFFMIAAPDGAGDAHMEILSRMMVLLMNDELVDKLRATDSVQQFLQYIDEAEEEKFGDKPKPQTAKKDGYRVLAVTACPTGIAHTYMAAEALEKSGKAKGFPLKAETNGSGGAKNVLTAQEIADCDGIIIAADKNVDTARFDGKKVLFAKVADGIHKPDELIDRVMSDQTPVFHAQGGAPAQNAGGDDSVTHTIYKHLMNGVSHMLPFVVGGGIMIALAFLLDDYTIDASNFGMNTPVARFFKTVGLSAFDYMLPILAAFIASSIADRPGLAVGFAGGVLAMNGTSITGLAQGDTTGISGGFLAALLAGFAAGYLVLGLKKITEKLPKSLDGIRPMLIYPLCGILTIGIVICGINPAMGGINTGISNWLNSMGESSKILLGLVLGGMMSVDMGGPVNKAAYVFGTAALSMGSYDVMAAVMIGGMVPPLAIALSTTFAKNKWTQEERQNGMVNYVMGLCFISEGAIPFAAADPLRVLPSCICGSAVAGALSMLFGCTLRAPHGGIFVFPVISNAPMYVVSLVVGSAVGAVLLSLLKKRKS